MIVKPFEPADLTRLQLQDAQGYLSSHLTEQDGENLAVRGLAWTGQQDNGDTLICAGVLPQWQGRAIAWALVSPYAGEFMVPITRKVKAFLDHHMPDPFRRIELTVDTGFAPGERWATMLGFEIEGFLRHYRPDGGNQLLYARVVT